MSDISYHMGRALLHKNVLYSMVNKSSKRLQAGAYQLEVGKALQECYANEMPYHPGASLSEY